MPAVFTVGVFIYQKLTNISHDFDRLDFEWVILLMCRKGGANNEI